MIVNGAECEPYLTSDYRVMLEDSDKMFIELSPMQEVGYYVEDLLEYDGNGNAFYDAIIEMMKTYHSLDDKSKTVIREYFKNVADGIKNKEEKA